MGNDEGVSFSRNNLNMLKPNIFEIIFIHEGSQKEAFGKEMKGACKLV